MKLRSSAEIVTEKVTPPDGEPVRFMESDKWIPVKVEFGPMRPLTVEIDPCLDDYDWFKEDKSDA